MFETFPRSARIGALVVALGSVLAAVSAPAGVAVAVGVAAAAGAGGPAPAHPGDVRLPSLEALSFMGGSWRAVHDGDVLEEHFSAPLGGSMIGMFRWISDGETGLTEHSVIEQHDDGVRYHLRHFHPGSRPWEQEIDGPMTYRLDRVEGSRAVFVDADRDFPRRIVYHRHAAAPEQMTVRLEGHHPDGTPREMQFEFRSTSMTTSTTSTESLTKVGRSIGYIPGLTIAFKVKDITKSIDFYQNVLGFKMMYHMEEMAWCELSTGVPGVLVGLSQVEDMKPGGPTPTFGVKDIDAARKQLEDKGVKFDGDTMEIPNMVKLATFFDPDGNSLMFFESLSE